MSCSSIVALPRACGSEGVVAGLEKMWVIAFADLATVGSTTNTYSVSTDGIVNQIALQAGKSFVQVGLLKSTAGLEETLTKDYTKGTAFFTQTMTVVLGGLSIENKRFIETCLNQPVVVLVKTKTQKFFAAGLNGLFELSAATGGSGIADADLQGHTLTFTGVDTKMTQVVDETIVPGLIGTSGGSGGGSTPQSFDSVIAFASSATPAAVAGVTGAAASTDAEQKLEFNAAQSVAGGVPQTMDVEVAGTQEASFSYLSGRSGDAFRYTDKAGVTHVSSFASGTKSF